MSDSAKSGASSDARAIRAIFVEIPAVHYGVKQRFGKRIPEPLYEGIRVKMPFIEKVELVSLSPRVQRFEVSFFSADKMLVVVKGSLQFRPNPAVTVESGELKGTDVFISMSEESVAQGIQDRVKARLLAIGGKHKGEDLITNKQAVQDLLDCTFRLKEMPHENHDLPHQQIPTGDPDKHTHDLECGMATGLIPEDKILEFYVKHPRTVRYKLNKEVHDKDDHSETERRYGIDIFAVELAEVDFSPETQKALEEARQAELRLKPVRTAKDLAIELKNEVGVDAGQALNVALTGVFGADSMPRQQTSLEIPGLAAIAEAVIKALTKK